MLPTPRARALASLLAGAVVLLVFAAIGRVYFDGFVLDLGTIFLPRERTISFLALWGLFGLAAALPVTAAIATALAPARGSARRRGRLYDRRFLLVASALALLIPAAIRLFVLQGAPLTDDESAYRFMGELLASGRLTAPSPPIKLFFDRAFMVNDGRLYAGYFVGWPALLVPGVLLGASGYVNSVLSALALPPLFWTARRLAGRRAARLAALLYLSSPMLMIGAATELTHTSCTAALAWLVWAVMRAREAGSPPVWDGIAALSFGVAFFVRPLSALGIGLPYLVAWLIWAWRDREQRIRRLTWFAVPAGTLAALFLLVNTVQNGSPLLTAYDRLLAYQRENDYRFSGFSPEFAAQFGNFRFLGVTVALAHTGVALFRLGFALFGWPCSYLLAAGAGLAGRTRLAIWSLVTFLVAHLFVADPGIDTFAPVHYFELAVPLLLLSAIGAKRLTVWGRQLGQAAWSRTERLAWSVGPALVLVALVGYWPVQLRALARIADTINAPREAVRAAGLRDAIVFAPRPFAPPCRSTPTHHFVFFRPNNDPDLNNEVLWVNHVTDEADRQLAARFPDRTPWVMVWDRECNVRLLSLERIPPGAIPPGEM